MGRISKNRIIAIAAIAVVLVVAFFWGGGFAKSEPSSHLKNKAEISTSQQQAEKTKKNEAEVSTGAVTADVNTTQEALVADEKSKGKAEASATLPKVDKKDVAYSEKKGMDINPETGKDKYLTDPVPEGKPVPVEPGTAKITKNAKTCTLSIECKTILDNMKYLDKEKVELVPEDGIIMAATTVTFYEGESVFNLLQRETKKNKIHMEFSNTPIYNSAYIEGIHNLYEFDCGELSGWMYKVNGWFPNYGCSRYLIQQGDVIEWIYTCDLGRDIGGGFDEK